MLRGEVQDLKRFCPETVDCFLSECEELIEAINTRQHLGDWEKCVLYQELLHEKLNRLASVADMQTYYGDASLESAQSQLQNQNTVSAVPCSGDATNNGIAVNGSAVFSSGSSAASAGRFCSSHKVIVGPSGRQLRWKKSEIDKLKAAIAKYGNPLDPEGSNGLSSLPLIAAYVLTKNEPQCKEKILELRNDLN